MVFVEVVFLVDLVGGQIDLDMVQMDLIEEDQVVLVCD